MLATEGLYTEVGRLIRARREALGLTQEALAKAAGLTRTSVTNIEKGRQKVLLHTLYKMAETLRTSPAELLPLSVSNLEVLLQRASDDERLWVKTTVEATSSEEDVL